MRNLAVMRLLEFAREIMAREIHHTKNAFDLQQNNLMKFCYFY
jgi:hypothetical protein